MVLKIIRKKVYLPFLLLIISVSACTKNEEPQPAESVRQVQREQKVSSVGAQSFSQGAESAMDTDGLDKIAELERSGRYSPGLGFTESGIRERAGDYAGAVVAAYKEMAWTFALSDTEAEGSLTLDQIKEGLNAVSVLYGTDNGAPVEDFRQNARAAVTAVTYFIDRKWTDAKDLFESLFVDDEEADSFAQWMILVCSLEQGDASRAEKSRYGAIRSRYEYFPEYWYHLARSQNDTAVRMDAAERCIFLAPRGPYASECRALIAEIFEIADSLSSSILVRGEIEYLITNTVSARNPEILRAFFPLLELPDNPYTMYAIGAMRALSADSLYKDFFLEEVSQSSGRLNERLVYISRG